MLATFNALLYTDLCLFKKVIFDKTIDLAIWVSTTMFVMSYLLPLFGVSAEFGALNLVGLAASAGLFELFPAVSVMISDFEHDRMIDYYFTTPLPSWMVFFKTMVFSAIQSLFLAAIALPVGFLFLKEPLAWGSVSWLNFIAMLVAMSLFYGAFTLFVTSFVKTSDGMGSVWMRIVYPLWFMGGFQFTWYSLKAVFPACAYLILLNPITYIMEGLRAAALGQAGYLPFWVCLQVVLLSTMLCGWIGIKRLLKRLDCI
jgi:ABC-2 type transport system permease protein